MVGLSGVYCNTHPICCRRRYAGYGVVRDENGKIFVLLIGGKTANPTNYDFNQVDRYDVENDSWQPMNNFIRTVNAATSLNFKGNGKEVLWLIGGRYDSEIYEYNVETDSWTFIADCGTVIRLASAAIFNV